jgi:hypothetical protein
LQRADIAEILYRKSNSDLRFWRCSLLYRRMNDNFRTRSAGACVSRLVFFLFLSCAGGSAIAETDIDSTEFKPPPDEYDWIQLTSDEWLKGEFISLFDEELLFDSDNLGMLEIDWEDVRRFRGHGLYGISIDGLDLFAGELRIDDQKIVITVEGIVREISRERLVSVTRSANRERDRWSGEVGLGMNIRSGNADIRELSIIGGIERRTPRSRFLLDYIGNFNETDGKEIANNHRANMSFDVFSGSRLFWRPFDGQYFRDRFQNIRGQGTVETGLGYELVDTPRTDWEISGGLGANFVSYESVQPGEPSDNTSPVLSISTDLDFELTSWMDYLLAVQMSFLDDESGAYQHHILTTLSTDLIGDLDLDVSFVWDRTQKPQQRADGTFPEKDDYWLMIGLEYEF